MWSSSTEIMQAIHDARERLRKGDCDTDTAHAEARLLATAVKLAMVQLDHAKLTGRLTQGSDALPPFVLASEAKTKR